MHKREQTNHNDKYVIFFHFDDDTTVSDGQTAETDERELPGR